MQIDIKRDESPQKYTLLSFQPEGSIQSGGTCPFISGRSLDCGRNDSLKVIIEDKHIKKLIPTFITAQYLQLDLQYCFYNISNIKNIPKIIKRVGAIFK